MLELKLIHGSYSLPNHIGTRYDEVAQNADN